MNVWEGFEGAACLASRCQCEAPRDALIRQPVSFWSSLAYIVTALVLLRSVRVRSFEFKMWTGACLLLGVASHLGHMSFTRLGLAFDFAAIVLILSFFALMNFLRPLRRSPAEILVAMVAYYGFLVLAMYSVADKWARVSICISIFTLSVGDVARERGLTLFHSRNLKRSLIVLLVSFGFFVLDEAHVLCAPAGVFQFHALWHLGTATALFFYGVWRFGELRP